MKTMKAVRIHRYGSATVLIHAAAGGVGSFAVQLATWKGAHVIGTASRRNHDFLAAIRAARSS